MLFDLKDSFGVDLDGLLKGTRAVGVFLSYNPVPLLLCFLGVAKYW